MKVIVTVELDINLKAWQAANYASSDAAALGQALIELGDPRNYVFSTRWDSDITTMRSITATVDLHRPPARRTSTRTRAADAGR
jgi:hypothetical protein